MMGEITIMVVLAGAFVTAILLFAFRHKVEVRVNVIVLAFLMVGIIAMALVYGADLLSQFFEDVGRLRAAQNADNANFAAVVAAGNAATDTSMKAVLGLVGLTSAVTAGIGVISFAMGGLLRSGNDLAEPHSLAVKALADNLPNGEKTGKIDEALIYSLEHLLAQARNGVLPKNPDPKGDHA